MVVLKISLILIGILFIGFGYFIFFKNKYSLINNFTEDKKKNRYDDKYAKRVGFIEFIGGLVILILGVFSLFLGDTFTIIIFLISILGIIVSLIVNAVLSKKTN